MTKSDEDDGWVGIDLSNFEANSRRAYAEQTGQEPVSREDFQKEYLGEWVNEDAPWDDQRDFEDLYSAETLWKARELIDGGRIHPEGHNKWVVEGSQPYIVNRLESEGMSVPWVVCSCPNGQARGGRPSCYHTAAVLALSLGIDLSHVEKPRKAPSGRRR